MGRRLFFGWLLLAAWNPLARGDGGTLRLWDRQDDYEIAVFTAPTPFVTGPVDISVLVLDSRSGEPVQNAKVVVRVARPSRPGEAVSHLATRGAATNRLFYAALFDLHEPGLWTMEVAIEGAEHKAKVQFEVEAAKALPQWLGLWPWVAWPIPVILLYGIHQWLVLRKTHPRAI